MSLTPAGLTLRDLYASESAKIESEFAAASNGHKAIEDRAALVDRIIVDLCRETLAADPSRLERFCLVALGGYGRRALFPFSDIDLMFLGEDKDSESRYRDGTRTLSRALWDLRLRLSPTNRTLAECDKFHRDNAEFNISLLDTRYLAGDPRLFSRLHQSALPHMIARERLELLRDVSELTRQRHEKEGDTIFHLEPNLKNSPGGLRDYHVACWVAQIEGGGRKGSDTPEKLWPGKVGEEMHRAFDFLAAARCFLHYRQGRDDNGLSYELQAEAAARGIGGEPGRAMEPADWMREYFRHARVIYGLSTQLLDDALPSPASFRDRVGNWISRRSPSDFNVVGGRVRVRQPEALRDPVRLLSLFEFIAREGVKLSREAEDQVREMFPALGAAPRTIAGTTSEAPPGTAAGADTQAVEAVAVAAIFPKLWEHLRQILVGPYAADALRAMHSCGLLVQFFPEFAVIDARVIRDFYHHYTVDAHSFRAIENIHRLRQADRVWQRPFAELFTELEQPELLFLSLLFHDVGKGMPGDDHVIGSLQAIERVFPRLGMKPADADTVRFLIRDHLVMSANLLRRDIFDPETIRAFAENVGTPERLKLLCLFTYADIRAVNPDALTPWKAESLWQLYVSTANYMSRSLDEERIHAQAADAQFVERVLPSLPQELLSSTTIRQQVSAFLEGLPRRYALAHSPEEVAVHFQMSRELEQDPVKLRLEKRDPMYVLTLLATDRPLLFAGITGTLASWGMNIWKAEAFANAAGVVVDTFHFTDPHSTLEMNPGEAVRLQKNIADILLGLVPLETLMHGRSSLESGRPPKVTVPTEIHFDDASSSHSTLMEIITQDRPGLLYRLSSALAKTGCNIEVALIDTEGQRALDAFYLTVEDAKLSPARQQTLREALLSEL
jgi:[protein-PII] uridylyltransferase